MVDQVDGPNSMDFPISVGGFTGHTRGADGEPLSFGPGTYYNVFDGDAKQAGNHTVPARARAGGLGLAREWGVGARRDLSAARRAGAGG